MNKLLKFTQHICVRALPVKFDSYKYMHTTPVWQFDMNEATPATAAETATF